jgi:hypothetical protein
VPGLALELEQALLDDGLGGDPGVVGAGHPERVVPSIRCQRMSRSCMTLSMAWPMCRAPVTFGRGIMMT